MLPGADEGLDDTNAVATAVQPFTIPTVISGGSGNDIIKGGNGPDLILGDASVVGGTWEGDRLRGDHRPGRHRR